MTTDTPTTAVPILVDRREAARLLGLGVRTVWQLTACGDLPCVRIGRAVRYRPEDLREWAARAAQGKGARP